ncbi:hypothetical protein GCM10010967_24530 [Dyadobacter beijingensis]|uniref:Glyoxalase/Bleomycin resistance-like N-terminal domain-containing protein n=1 Tax=Dyadobacter beijingensis TaxID=365489 RepID=A0ABQ2HUQ2_9BACT|nr:VOC family protein [Dyadobacter beijingensis]GGM90562.1 hypothetical protein GCM10010967_24530 [Dyadobacter beijingensis]
MLNAINWFEIPVKDFDRAKAFYETILGATITEMPNDEYRYGMLPADMQNGGVGGGIVYGEGFEPSMSGSLIYLNGGTIWMSLLQKWKVQGAKFSSPKLRSARMGLWLILLIRREIRSRFILWDEFCWL